MTKKYRLNEPMLIQIVGIPGAGKSTLADKLSSLITDTAYISKDMIQSAFTEKRVVGEAYSYISLPTLKILSAFSEKQLGHNTSPIIDAPFSMNHTKNDETKYWVDFFKCSASKYRVRHAIIKCSIPEDELKKRLKSRGYERDLWKLENWEEFREKEPENFPIGHDDVMTIITANIETAVVHSLQYLGARSI